MGRGGGVGVTSHALEASVRGGLTVWSQSVKVKCFFFFFFFFFCLLSDVERRRSAQIACENSFFLFFLRETFGRRSKWAILWCATASRPGSRCFRVGSRMVSFQYRLLVHPGRRCFRCRNRTFSWRLSCLMASLWLSFWLQVSFDAAAIDLNDAEDCSSGPNSCRRRSAWRFSAGWVSVAASVMQFRCMAFLGQGPEADDPGRPSADFGQPVSSFSPWNIPGSAYCAAGESTSLTLSKNAPCTSTLLL